MRKRININLILSVGSVLAIILIVSVWMYISRDRGTDQPRDTANQEQNTTGGQSNNDQGEVKKPAVTEAELARLKAQGVVSSDDKYYIKAAASGFPKIVSVETGDEYNFRPGANYTKVSKVTWSGDGKILAYIFGLPDADYANKDIFNTATIDEVVAQKFGNAGRILTAADKLDYVWLDGNQVLYTQLLNYDSVKKDYLNATVGTYNINSEKFGNPWGSAYADNIYSIDIGPGQNKFLYVQAVTDDNGITTRQYVTVDYSGKVLKKTAAYDKDWAK